jgi:DUF971 family protein
MGLLDKIKPHVPAVRPAELGIVEEGALRIRWDDGQDTRYPARWLRARCPCAGCVEEWSGRRTVGDAEVAADVKPLGMDAVGRYAVQINWSDGHSTGIYSWDYLFKLRTEQAAAAPPPPKEP